jgi:magnesium transporter
MGKAKRRRKRKNKQLPRRHGSVGAPPGTLDIDPSALTSTFSLIAYGPDKVEERKLEAKELKGLRGSAPVVWVNVDGLGDAAALEATRASFGLHPLALEDVVHVQQRPKVELYRDHLFIVIPMVREDTDPDTSATEQIAIFLGEDFVLTFQERPGDCLDPVRNRIRQGLGRIRGEGADYLAYALVDTIVDRYFPLIEGHVEALEALEDSVLTGHVRDVSLRVHEMQHKLRNTRRVAVPLQATISALLREQSPLIRQETRVYLRDCHDHAVQLVDILEHARDTAVGLMDLHLSIANQQMSEVMKLLTIIATIFIPLSFIAGLYGMNFDRGSSWNMPELGWKYGYLFALGLMLAVAVGLIALFVRRGWIWKGN